MEMIHGVQDPHHPWAPWIHGVDSQHGFHGSMGWIVAFHSLHECSVGGWFDPAWVPWMFNSGSISRVLRRPSIGRWLRSPCAPLMLLEWIALPSWEWIVRPTNDTLIPNQAQPRTQLHGDTTRLFSPLLCTRGHPWVDGPHHPWVAWVVHGTHS